MHPALAELSKLAVTPAKFATTKSVVAACTHVRELLGASDAYVIRGGDPQFVRLGSNLDPAEYEIKQRGYWLAWRELASHAGESGRLIRVTNRLVDEILAAAPNVPATHFVTTLPANESNSELLVVQGPWPSGLSEDQIALLEVVRPLMAYLVANVLDGERQERVRSQLRSLSEISEAFSQAEQSDAALPGLATAMAGAAGFAWVQILLFDQGIEHVTDRALNLSRHSNTEAASQAREGRQSDNSVERDIRVARHLAWTRLPYLVPDVSDPEEQFLVNDELRPYYERAHVLSMGIFPVMVQDQLLGTITFSASERREFDQREVDFLLALVAQAAPTIKAFQLNRELREAEQRLRAVFANAPVFITVFEPDGTIALSEGAGLSGVGQSAGALVGKRVYDVLSRKHWEYMRSNIERGLRGERFGTSLELGGAMLRSQYAPLRDENGKPSAVIGVSLDVTEQHRAELALVDANVELKAAKERAEELARKAEYLARYDALTGVLSRRAWFEDAKGSSPTAVAVLDIDTFKAINDGYGHPVGDAVLRMVAERISTALQGEGVLGRLGGEEFGILFETSMKTAEAICRRAVELVGSIPCLVAGGVLLRVTLSAGLAPCPDEETDPARRVDRGYELADKALYAAKHAGRHQLVVAPAA